MTRQSVAPKRRAQSRTMVAMATALLIATSGALVALAAAPADAGQMTTSFWSGKSEDTPQPSDGYVTIDDPESTVVSVGDKISLHVSAVCDGPIGDGQNANISFTLNDEPLDFTGDWTANETAEPTVSPSISAEPSISPEPSVSAEPSISPEPSVSAEPSISPEPSAPEDLLIPSAPDLDRTALVTPIVTIAADTAGPSTFSGTLTFIVVDAPSTLRVSEAGASCFGDDFTETVAEFTTLQPECPALPGTSLLDQDTAFAVTDPDNVYTTTWDTDSDGTIEDVSGETTGHTSLNEDGFDGWNANLFLNTEADGTAVYMNSDCLTRDTANATDYMESTDDNGELTYSASNKYLSSADTVRRTWTFTNNTAEASSAQAVTILSNLGSDDYTTTVDSKAYGRTSNDGSENGHESNGDPVITTLWGGPAVSLVSGGLFASAPIASNMSDASNQSSAWLDGASTLPLDYFAGLNVDKVLNWGPGSTAPAVSQPSDGDDNIATTYEIPSLAAGQTINVVEFAHVQYYPVSEDTNSGQLPWVDDTLANGTIGTPYTDSVTAPEGDLSYTSYSAPELPAGLEIDNEGHVTGTPTGEPGNYIFDIMATNEVDFIQIAQNVHLTIAAAAIVPVPPTPVAPALGLQLNFKVGTSIADASTTAQASGLLEGSAWTLQLFSTPQTIASGFVPAGGSISQLVHLPANLPAGNHHLLLSGTAADGTPMRSLAYFTLGANGKILALSLTGPTPTLAELAATGANVSGFVIFAGLASLAGIALLLSGLLLRARRVRLS